VERRVQFACACELGEAQREPCIGDDRRPVVLKARLGEPRVQRIVLADADAVVPMELGQRNPCRRILRVQVERKPGDLGVELAP
jgi:hypothetical protein